MIDINIVVIEMLKEKIENLKGVDTSAGEYTHGYVHGKVSAYEDVMDIITVLIEEQASKMREERWM